MDELRENQKFKLPYKTADGSEKNAKCSNKSLFPDRTILNYLEEVS